MAFLLAHEEARGVHLDRLYADPDHWRGGAGQRLWDELVAWAKGRGAWRIFFEVAADGAPAPAFYAKQGCRKRGELVEPIGATPVRVARYTLELGRSARLRSLRSRAPRTGPPTPGREDSLGRAEPDPRSN